MSVALEERPEVIDLRAAFSAAGFEAFSAALDRDLVGLKPVNARIREIASLLLIGRVRQRLGFQSRIAHRIDFPDDDSEQPLSMAETVLRKQNYRFFAAAREAMDSCIEARREKPFFSNTHSIRNALDRARLRQAGRLIAHEAKVAPGMLMEIAATDVLASCVFAKDGA